VAQARVGAEQHARTTDLAVPSDDGACFSRLEPVNGPWRPVVATASRALRKRPAEAVLSACADETVRGHRGVAEGDAVEIIR